VEKKYIKLNNIEIDSIISQNIETDDLEFKENFNPKEKSEWPEIIKDIVAIATSGGGFLVFGVDKKGINSESDVTHLLEIDPAEITNKIHKYTGSQFANFSIRKFSRNEKNIVTFCIDSCEYPLVFCENGNYIFNGKQKNAFNEGTVYFRHGAKSEPGDSQDIRNFIDRKVEVLRESWQGKIRRVIEAPLNSKITIVSPDLYVEDDNEEGAKIRFTDDPNAPAYRNITTNETYPYRSKEVAQIVNKRIGKKVVTTPRIYRIRKLFNLDEIPSFVFRPKYSSPQYSEDFVDWLVNQLQKDELFYEKAKEEKRNKLASKI
jgi:hypothetical protein